jgi:P-type conjugative transfer ATPase TrbB
MTSSLADSAVLSMQEERLARINEKLRRELGPVICGFLAEPLVIEIMLNPDGQLWVERLGSPMEPAGIMTAIQAEALMATVASTLRTTITRENPILECELPLDGSRFEALLPPVVHAPTFTIRKKAAKVFTLDEYVEHGIMTSHQRDVICSAIVRKQNILVVGGTGSGKTTLTNAIIDHIAKAATDDRLVIIEDIAEIQCRSPNAVILRATADVDMLRLLKATMRLRPDRIIVGEVRGPEALALLKSWNTGHPGGVATVHANDARAGLLRIEALIAEDTQAPMQKTIATAVNVIVSIAKTDGGRRVQEFLRVLSFDGHEYITKPEE